MLNSSYVVVFTFVSFSNFIEFIFKLFKKMWFYEVFKFFLQKKLKAL